MFAVEEPIFPVRDNHDCMEVGVDGEDSKAVYEAGGNERKGTCYEANGQIPILIKPGSTFIIVICGEWTCCTLSLHHPSITLVLQHYKHIVGASYKRTW